jgi:hypothetical protein
MPHSTEPLCPACERLWDSHKRTTSAQRKAEGKLWIAAHFHDHDAVKEITVVVDQFATSCMDLRAEILTHETIVHPGQMKVVAAASDGLGNCDSKQY